MGQGFTLHANKLLLSFVGEPRISSSGHYDTFTPPLLSAQSIQYLTPRKRSAESRSRLGPWTERPHSCTSRTSYILWDTVHHDFVSILRQYMYPPTTYRPLRTNPPPNRTTPRRCPRIRPCTNLPTSLYRRRKLLTPYTTHILQHKRQRQWHPFLTSSLIHSFRKRSRKHRYSLEDTET